ncbi:MAG: DUF2993 domain-containing protein [Synechococcaceae cyanobacterium RL_1_2]|nr:DUF2993 domain-containing protein [Synechococcaceae cyanobacterium RL_1_2]
MSIFTTILVSTIALANPTGLITDTIIEQQIRDRIVGAEELVVRVDNTPVHNVFTGKIDRFRLAARNMEVTPELTLELLDIETDPIDINLKELQSNPSRKALDAPFGAAMHVVIGEDSLNRSMDSPQVEELINQIFKQITGGNVQITEFRLVNPGLDFDETGRMTLKIDWQRLDPAGQPVGNALAMMLSTRLQLVAGDRIELFDPIATINDKPISSRLLNGFTRRINGMSIDEFSPEGVTLRFLNLAIEEERMDMALFIRVEPEK